MFYILKLSLEPVPDCADSGCMAQPYFTNAPRNVTFVGGDPEMLRKVQTVELGVLGDRGLADRLNDALLSRESGIYGFPVQEEILNLRSHKLATRG